MSTYKILITKAPTGSGKTYTIIQDAIFTTFCFKKTSIIATTNKKLVDQIYDDAILFYKNEKINGQKISKKKISILKHTRDDNLTKELLLNLFIKGDGIIITVHNYLYAFDDFYNTSFLNALTYIFPKLVNIYYDEADNYINSTYTENTLIYSLIKHNDSLIKGSNFYLNEDWSKTKNISEAIKIIQPSNSKNSGEDGVCLIKTNMDISASNKDFIELEPFIKDGNISIKFKNLFNKNSYDNLNLISDDAQMRQATSTTYKLQFDSDLKQRYLDYKVDILSYNYLSTILKKILNSEDPLRYQSELSEFTKIAFYKSDDNTPLFDKFFIAFSNYLKQSYFENKLFLNNEDKQEFFKDFDIHFEKYKNIAIEKGRLFDIISISNGNESLLRLMYTSFKTHITFYYPFCKICKILLIKSIEYKTGYNVEVLDLKSRKLENIEELYELKKNTDSLSDLIKAINFSIKKKNSFAKESGKSQEDDHDEKGVENVQYTTEKNKDEIYKFNIDKVKVTDKKNVIRQLESYFFNNLTLESIASNTFELNIILSMQHPDKLVPFGVELQIFKDLDYSRRLLGDKRIFTSANYDYNTLNTFSKINQIFAKNNDITIQEDYFESCASTRKIDTLYLLLNGENYRVKNSKRDFYKQYWNTFSKNFYDKFTNVEEGIKKKIGMIALPSNKKVVDFYQYIGFKNYISYIDGGNQRMSSDFNADGGLDYISTFNPNETLKQGGGLFLTSVFGTASAGLNMPHLFYLNVSLDNYKPKYTHKNISIEIKGKLANPKYQIIYDSLIQIVGRLTRLDKDSDKQIKILEVCKIPPYEDMLFFHIFIKNLIKVFKQIHVIDISSYESLTFKIIRSKKLATYFDKYQQCVKSIYVDPLSTNICGKYLAEFRISLINLLKDNHTNDDFDELFKEIIYKYYKKVVNLVFFAIIGLFYDTVEKSFIKKKEKLHYSKLKEKLPVCKLPLFNKVYNQIKPFYDELNLSHDKVGEFLNIYKKYEKNNLFDFDKIIKDEISDIDLIILKTYNG